MKRGIITPPYNLVFLGKGSGFHVGKILNPYDVNYFLLYWDKVVVPSNNYIGTTLHLEKEMLDMGFLERPRFEFQSNNDAMDMLEFCKHVQNVSLAKNREESDIDWVLHEMGESQEQLESSELPSNLRFELYNALPVPPKSVHAEEILNFKIQRKDQLNSLHQLMDELYKEVISSRDINFSKSHAFSRLNQAIIDVNRVSEEKWNIPLRFDVSANFETDLNTIYQSALATGATYFAGGAHAAVATATLGGLGYIASSIKINFTKRKPLNPDVKRVEYLARASKQKIL